MVGSVSLLVAIVFGVFIFGVGYFWARFKNARGGVNAAKALVPAARKSFWNAVWSLIKWGVGAATVVIVLIAWTMSDVNASNDQSTPSPSPSRSARR